MKTIKGLSLKFVVKEEIFETQLAVKISKAGHRVNGNGTIDSYVVESTLIDAMTRGINQINEFGLTILSILSWADYDN